MVSRITLLTLTLSLQIISYSGKAQLPNASDVTALKDIYNSFTNASAKLGWDLSGDPYSWSLLAWENGRVTALYFGDIGLNGTLSSSIGNLTELRLIYLQRSNLTGSIPSSIGNLSNLVGLFMSDNEFSGELPESFYNLTALQAVDLGANKLTGILSEKLGDLTSLTSLDLSNNQFEGPLPESIGKLKSLSFFYMPNNSFTSIPSTIGDMESLSTLDLASNNIQEIPSSIGNLVGLTNLTLSENSISELPDEIGNLTSLMFLTVDGNRLTSLPETIGNLQTLLRIILDSNELSSLPNSFSNLQMLGSIYISNNSFESFPPEIAELENLRSLYFNNNQLKEIGTDLGKLNQLADIRLIDNEFEIFPVELGELSSLVVLEMANNKMSGSIPLSIRKHPTLRRLGLENNNFSTMEIFQSPSIVRLFVVNNLLPFVELEKNLDYLYYPVDYDPQRWEAEPDTIVILNEGESAILDSEIGGAYTTYRWYKNQIQIDGAEPFLSVNATEDFEGTYNAVVRNTKLAGTMESRNFNVVKQLQYQSQPVLIESNLISLKWEATFNKSANAYYIIDEISSPLPTAEQIKNGLNANNEAVPSGSNLFFKGVPDIVEALGLSLGHSSRVVIYAEDESQITSTEIFVLPVVVASIEENDHIHIYPNPASEVLNIYIKDLESNVEIIDLSGKILYSNNLPVGLETIDIMSWSPGLYFISIGPDIYRFIKH